MRDDCIRSCALVLDGLLLGSLDFGLSEIHHQVDSPPLYLGLPGRLILPETSMDPDSQSVQFAYNNWHCPVDTWVATFSWKAIPGLFRTDGDYALALLGSATLIQADMCTLAALLRSDYTCLGLAHLLEMLCRSNAYLTQADLALLMNHDRTAI